MQKLPRWFGPIQHESTSTCSVLKKLFDVSIVWKTSTTNHLQCAQTEHRKKTPTTPARHTHARTETEMGWGVERRDKREYLKNWVFQGMEDRHLFLLNVVRKRVNMCVAGGWIAWLIKAKSWFSWGIAHRWRHQRGGNDLWYPPPPSARLCFFQVDHSLKAGNTAGVHSQSNEQSAWSGENHKVEQNE